MCDKTTIKNLPHTKRVAALPCEINFHKLLEPKHDNQELSGHKLKKMWSW